MPFGTSGESKIYTRAGAKDGMRRRAIDREPMFSFCKPIDRLRQTEIGKEGASIGDVCTESDAPTTNNDDNDDDENCGIWAMEDEAEQTHNGRWKKRKKEDGEKEL